MQRRVAIVWAVVWLGAAACGENGGCGGDGSYQYPRADPTAALTQRTARFRLTQVGFDAVARGVPGLLRTSCAPTNPPTPGGPCDLDPVNPDEVRFLISQPGAPLQFSVLGSDGEIRPGGLFAIDTASLDGNVHIRLVDVAGGQDGFQITLGCNADNLAACTNSAQFARGSLDLVFFIERVPLLWQDSACFAQDRTPSTAGVTIRSMRFTVFPRIELGPDARPYLLVEDADVQVNRFDLELDLQVGQASWDAVCQAAGTNCNLCNSVDNTIDWVLEPVLESNLVASLLATVIVRQVFGSFADKPLDVEGQIGGAEFLGITNPAADPVGYRLAANIDSPDVTGTAGELGLNFDFDAGFVANHNACVGTIASPSWVLPAAPDPGAMVTAADPVTGVLRPEAFDAALLVGDVLAERALFELFDGGHTCLDLSAETVEELANGAFVPSIGSLALIAPGLAGLGPADAPVDLAVVPRFPPRVAFGTGEGQGAERDSHLQVAWAGVGLELYPLVDDAFIRALAFSFDAHLRLSLLPTPSGDLEIFVDDIRLENVVETYNEMNLRFDANGFVELVGLFLPLLLTGDPIPVALTADTLGFPFVPKVRAVRAIGTNERYLGVFVHFCIADDLTDPGNPLCYPSAGNGGNAPRFALGAELVSAQPAAARLRVHSDRAADDLELAVRLDGVGPWYGRAGPDADGLFTLAHPWLALEGWHRLEVVAHERQRPGLWSMPAEVMVLVDRRPPSLRARRAADRILVEVSDDWTPNERIEVRGELHGGGTFGWSARRDLPAAPGEGMTLWARDDVGNESPAWIVPAELSRPPARPEPVATGCRAVDEPLVLALALVALAAGRRRRVGGR